MNVAVGVKGDTPRTAAAMVTHPAEVEDGPIEAAPAAVTPE